MNPSNDRRILARKLWYVAAGFYCLAALIPLCGLAPWTPWVITSTCLGLLALSLGLLSTNRRFLAYSATKSDQRLFKAAAELREPNEPIKAIGDLDDSDVIRLRDADRKLMAVQLYHKLHPEIQNDEAWRRINTLSD